MSLRSCCCWYAECKAGVNARLEKTHPRAAIKREAKKGKRQKTRAGLGLQWELQMGYLFSLEMLLQVLSQLSPRIPGEQGGVAQTPLGSSKLVQPPNQLESHRPGGDSCLCSIPFV